MAAGASKVIGFCIKSICSALNAAYTSLNLSTEWIEKVGFTGGACKTCRVSLSKSKASLTTAAAPKSQTKIFYLYGYTDLASGAIIDRSATLCETRRTVQQLFPEGSGSFRKVLKHW